MKHKILLVALMLFVLTGCSSKFDTPYKFGDATDFSISGRVMPQIVVDNPSIVNDTDLKVYLLYDSQDETREPIKFGESLYRPTVCDNNGELVLGMGKFTFVINPDGLWIYDRLGAVCRRRLDVHEFTTNLQTEKLENGDTRSWYELETRRFDSRLGTIEIERKQMRCQDTGRNPVTIFRNGKTLAFQEIGNVSVFEFDNDHDGKSEVYLVNYYCCEGRLEIYKIDDK